METILFFCIFPAESESGVKSRGLTAYIEHNLKKLSKNHVSVTSKTLSFYVFWLAESEFVMEKEIWPPNFGDNLKKLLSQFAQELNWLTLAYTLVIERPMQRISTPLFVISKYISF